jgi:hypothetical protein
MKLESKEINDLHLVALEEWDGYPKVVRLINFAHVIHVRFLAWLIRTPFLRRVRAWFTGKQ